mgnify:FL=1
MGDAMLRWILTDLAVLLSVSAFVFALLVAADAIAHSPTLVW